jgi:FkbM family methyltransferase
MNFISHCASAVSRVLAATNHNVAHKFAVWYGKQTMRYPNHLYPLTWERVIRTADGFLMRVQFQESLGRRLMFKEIHEPELVQRIRAHLHEGEAFIDVGANQGYYTLMASRIVGPQGRVLAFEPSPMNLARLAGNLALNICNNVLLFSEALSSGHGVGKLSLPWAINSGVCSLGNGPSAYGNTAFEKGYTLTAMQSLDKVLATIEIEQKIAIVKIDAEGHEFEILQGMKNLLATTTDLKIACEISPQSYSVKEFFEFMQQWGFTGELYDKTSWKPINPACPPVSLCNAWFWRKCPDAKT